MIPPTIDLSKMKAVEHKTFAITDKNAEVGRPYSKIKGLDVDGGMKRLANRWDFYDRLVSRFYLEHLDFFERFENEKKLGNHEAVRRMLHSLKGITGTIGATELYPLAIEAEQAQRTESPDAGLLIAKAGTCLSNLLAEILNSGCFSIEDNIKG